MDAERVSPSRSSHAVHSPVSHQRDEGSSKKETDGERDIVWDREKDESKENIILL